MDENITYWEIPHIERKGISKGIMPAACIQLHNHDLIWKSSIKTKPLNTKQCPAGLSPRIICQVSPFLPKVSKNCYTHQVWTVPPSTEPLMENPGDGGKSYPTAKHLLISPIRKIFLNRFKSFAIKSFIYSPSSSNFQVITLCNLHS